MSKGLHLRLLSLGIAIVLPVSAVLAASTYISADAEEEAGLCTELGCRSGPTKCADGVLTTSGGTAVSYTCFTTVQET